MNFLLWKLSFPGVGTIVSFKGNSRFSVRERPFPNGKHIKRLLYPLSEVNNKTEQRPTQIDTEGSRLWWDVADTNNDAGERNKPNNFRSATLSKLKF